MPMGKLKIMHIALESHFTEDMTYQENQLSYQNVLDGHEVLCISDSKKFIDGILIDVGYEDGILENGVRLIRLPYEKILSRFVSEKIRKVHDLYKIMDEFHPDVILSHDLCYLSVFDVIRYKKDHPQCRLYADTHTARYNSGRNWISLRFLHGLFYRFLVQNSLPYLEKYLYIGENEKIFNEKVYGVPNSKLEYYPIGGVLFADEEYQTIREKRRKELGINSDELLYVHSGKMEKAKCTKELIEAFSSVDDPKSKMVIIGTIPESQKEIINPLIYANKRISFLGWKSGAELSEYLCACDVYSQPGTVSATLQNAICKYCAIMTYPHLHYVKHLDFGNMFFVKSEKEIEMCFNIIKANPKIIDKMKFCSRKCAETVLDYKKLAARLYL